MALLDQHPNPNLKQQRIGRRELVSGVFVPHSAENTPDYVAFDGGAEAVWNFIRTRTTYGSYHFLGDSDSRLQVVDWWNEAFHDATDRGNWHEIGGSIATRADVLPLAPRAWRDAAIDNLARGFADAARWVRGERGIIVPAKRITRAESQARKPGFIAHGSRDPGRRSDPGFDQNPELWAQFLDRYSVHAADVLGSDRPSPPPPPPKEDPIMAAITADQVVASIKAGTSAAQAADMRSAALVAELVEPIDRTDPKRPTSRQDRLIRIVLDQLKVTDTLVDMVAKLAAQQGQDFAAQLTAIAEARVTDAKVDAVLAKGDGPTAAQILQ